MASLKKAWRVEVEWSDSTIPHAGWMRYDSVVDPAYRKAIVRCVSVGILIADDEAGVALAASVHGSEVAGVTIIPRGQILKVRRLSRA